jgi:hypothetical protein
LIRQGKVFDPFFSAQRHQIIIEILTEGAVGEPEKLEMKPLEAFTEGLQLTEKPQLLQLDVTQQSVRFRKMQHIEQERAIDCNLVGLSHRFLSDTPGKVEL